MSQEHVDRFRDATDAFNRRDLESWLRFYDSAVVFEPRVTEFEGSLSGHDGLARFLADIGEEFESFQVDLTDVRDLGDRVLALGTARGRGKESGVETEASLAIIASFRNGKCVRFKDYGDTRQALEAAGLSE
jgi:ketosteroid isomerase-like protein